METKELNIEVPVGYEIDKEKSTFEKIIFKKKDNRPRSWEEYCEQHSTTVTECYFLDNEADVRVFGWHPDVPSDHYRNTLPSKELTEAFRAMMQLMSVREDWIGDWKPDWSCENTDKYFIQLIGNKEFEVQRSFCWCKPLSFPTYEEAKDFMRCFKELLEIAKPLI